MVELSERYGLYIDPDALIQDITVGMQQRVEILKMLYRDNEIMIFDEPTAVLTPQEIDELMEIMGSLVAEGKSILFITHKLDEIKAVADRCSVLRRGKYIGTVDVASITKEEMSEMMVGRKVSLSVEKTPAAPGRTVLEAEHVSVKSHMEGHTKLVVNDVSFQVRSGEIVCIAGIDGNGQTELVHAITGLGETAGGRILINGRDVTKRAYAPAIPMDSAIYRRTGTSMAWCWIITWPITWCCSSILSLGSSTGVSLRMRKFISMPTS